MKIFEITLCLEVFIFTIGIRGNTISPGGELKTGYYWKDYVGEIPSDALPGGVDKVGRITYIGQTSHIVTPKDGITFGSDPSDKEIQVPGQIRETDRKMTYEWNYIEHVATRNVKILCTHHPEQFEWIPTDKYDILNLSNKHLVIGGAEENFQVYIGRVFLDEEVAVGKVLITHDPMMEGIYTTLNGKYLHIQFGFEVLAYNKTAPLLSEKHVTLKLKPRLGSTTNNGLPLQVDSSFEVLDDNESEKPKSKSNLRSPNSSTTNALWCPLFVVVLVRAFQEIFKMSS